MPFRGEGVGSVVAGSGNDPRDEGATMNDSPALYAMVTLNAAALTPNHPVTLHDGRISVRLSPMGDENTIYLDGTLDELAQFVADLAGVVRELTARELAAS